MKTILVTGGLGYIGSHVVSLLHENKYEVVIFDNLSNCHFNVLKRLEQLTSKKFSFFKGHIENFSDIDAVFKAHKIDLVIHAAGQKSVGESVTEPAKYYNQDFMGTVWLLEAMKQNNCSSIIFSSSATVYKPSDGPCGENFPLGCANPYGWSKLFAEQAIQDFCSLGKIKSVVLRYFNPVGAHKSGLLGEYPTVAQPPNILPFIQRVSVGLIPELTVFGGDWATRDGTGVRDYIDISDLAEGHLKAAVHLMDKMNEGELEHINLGTANGVTVLELVAAYVKATGQPVPYKMGPRRAGDIDTCISDPSKARDLLNWTAKVPIEESCVNSYNFTKRNPKGFEDELLV